MRAGSPRALPSALREGVEAALSQRVARSVEILGAEPMTGGCIHETARLSTNLQEDFFLKWAQGPPTDVFAAEADGLSALRNSTDLTVPEVIGYSDAEEKPAGCFWSTYPTEARVGITRSASERPSRSYTRLAKARTAGTVPTTSARSHKRTRPWMTGPRSGGLNVSSPSWCWQATTGDWLAWT